MRFSPALTAFFNGFAAASTACTQVQALFVADFRAVLAAESGASLEALLPALRGCERLIAATCRPVSVADGGHAVALFDVAAFAAPRIYAWVTARLEQLRAWSQRNMAAEKWTGTSGTRGDTLVPPAHSAVELARAVHEAVVAFLKLSVFQARPAQDLCRGVLQLYCDYVLGIKRLCGDVATLVPPALPLTRFKASNVELLKQLPMASQQQRPTAKPQGPSFEEALVMHASLAFLDREVAELGAEFSKGWVTLSKQARALRLPHSDSDEVSLCNIFPLKHWQDEQLQTLSYLAYRAVFVELRAFVDGMYSLGSPKANSASLLTPLDGLMKRICETAGESRDAAAGAVLSAVAKGLLLVLLDGGPTRVFVQDEAGAVAADVAAIAAFFEAGGDGLSPAQVAAALAPVRAVVEAMGMDTHMLCSRAKDSKMHLHVLAHRADRVASKFLKNLGMPKALGAVQETSMRLAKLMEKKPA